MSSLRRQALSRSISEAITSANSHTSSNSRRSHSISLNSHPQDNLQPPSDIVYETLRQDSGNPGANSPPENPYLVPEPDVILRRISGVSANGRLSAIEGLSASNSFNNYHQMSAQPQRMTARFNQPNSLSHVDGPGSFFDSPPTPQTFAVSPTTDSSFANASSDCPPYVSELLLEVNANRPLKLEQTRLLQDEIENRPDGLSMSVPSEFCASTLALVECSNRTW